VRDSFPAMFPAKGKLGHYRADSDDSNQDGPHGMSRRLSASQRDEL